MSIYQKEGLDARLAPYRKYMNEIWNVERLAEEHA